MFPHNLYGGSNLYHSNLSHCEFLTDSTIPITGTALWVTETFIKWLSITLWLLGPNCDDRGIYSPVWAGGPSRGSWGSRPTPRPSPCTWARRAVRGRSTLRRPCRPARGLQRRGRLPTSRSCNTCPATVTLLELVCTTVTLLKPAIGTGLHNCYPLETSYWNWFAQLLPSWNQLLELVCTTVTLLKPAIGTGLHNCYPLETSYWNWFAQLLPSWNQELQILQKMDFAFGNRLCSGTYIQTFKVWKKLQIKGRE
jgi:hypothetical protein